MALGLIHTASVINISGSTGGLDPLIQNLVNGNYNGKTLKIYKTTTGYPGTDTLLASYTLATPAAPLANVITAVSIRVDLVSASVVVTGALATSEYAYGVIDEAGTRPLYASAGVAGNDFNARIVLSRGDLFPGDLLALSSIVFTATSALDHYDLTRSPSSGISSDSDYIVTAQAKTLGGANVDIMRHHLVGSYVSVSGAGANGSVDSTPVVSNRHGLFEPIDVTAGFYPKSEEVHVSDLDGILGTTSTLVVLDYVDSYVVTVANYTPGPGTTVVVTAQARFAGSNAAVSGRTVTWSTTLAGASFGAPTSVTNGSGIATVNITYGSIGSSGTITATDSLSETGSSSSISISTQPPVYTSLTSGTSFGGSAVTTASITVPASGWIVVRIGALVDNGHTFTCAGSGLTFTTPSNGVALSVNGFISTTQACKIFIAQASGSGFTGTLTFDSSGADHVLMAMWEIGYFSNSEISGTFRAYNEVFSSDSSLKDIAFTTSPATTSRLLSAFTLHNAVGGAASWTGKSSPAWTNDSNPTFSGGGFGAVTSCYSYGGSDTPTEATPNPSLLGPQLGVALEVLHA